MSTAMDWTSKLAALDLANLRSCNMSELTTVTADHGLTAFHHQWIDDLFRKAST